MLDRSLRGEAEGWLKPLLAALTGQSLFVVGGATVAPAAAVVVVASVPQTGLSDEVTTSSGVAESTEGGGVVESGPATMARPFNWPRAS